MWTLQQGETTHWTLYNREKHIQGCTPPRILRPHLCYANSSIQTMSQTCQIFSKVDHSMARRCYLSTAGLLPGHRLEHVQRGSHLQPSHRLTRVHRNSDCLHQEVHRWCDSHQDHHHTSQPEAMDEVHGLLKIWDEAFRSGDKAALKTARWHQEGKTSICSKISTIASVTLKTPGPCGKPFRPSLATSPCHRPVTMTHPCQMHSTTSTHDLRYRTTHTCTKTAHISKRPGALSVSSWRKEDPVQD